MKMPPELQTAHEAEIRRKQAEVRMLEDAILLNDAWMRGWTKGFITGAILTLIGVGIALWLL